MLYLIKEHENDYEYNKPIYTLFETHTDSVLIGNGIYVSKLVNTHKMEIKNAVVKYNRVYLKNTWPRGVYNDNYKSGIYIFLGAIGNNIYKIINHYGCVKYIDENKLKHFIKGEFIVNCTYEVTEIGTQYKSVDTLNIKVDPKFEKYIADCYREFISKTNTLGFDMRFDYVIENDDVKLDMYRGTSKKVNIPKFVTSISEQAFYDMGIKHVSFNRGLKYIGSNAFKLNELSYVEIPETVEFIGQWAFHGNRALFNQDGYKYNTFKLESTKTKILNGKEKKSRFNGIAAEIPVNSYEKRQ